MRRMLMAAAAFSTLSVSTGMWAPAAQAREWPWCAVLVDRTSSSRNCGFDSWKQCEEYVNGIGGYCERNPFYESPRPRHRRRYR